MWNIKHNGAAFAATRVGRNRNRVMNGIDSGYVVRQGYASRENPKPMSLAYRIESGTAVSADHLALRIHDVPLLHVDVSCKEIGHAHVAHEAEPLAVLLVRDRQREVDSQASHIRLSHVADGEHHARHVRARDPV
jgi:hypothetical protein